MLINWEWWKPVVKGAVGAILGGLLVLGVVRVYNDYLIFRQVVGFINTYGPRIAKLPE